VHIRKPVHSKLFYFVPALLLLISMAVLFQNYAREIIHWVELMGWLAPVLFLFIYCLATLLFLPTMIVTLAGSALFGPFLGTALNLAGATLGATFSFLITRYLFQEQLRKQQGLIFKIVRSVEQKGWLSVAFLRLFPIVPFNFVNYALGATTISLRTYLVTTIAFLLPPEIIYTYCGYAGRDFALTPDKYRASGLLIIGLIFLLYCLSKIYLRIKKLPQIKEVETEFFQ